MTSAEILIAVIGITGAGKTTFISKATGRTDLEIGHSIESCTSQVDAHTFSLAGRRVTLIDTPGFDDTWSSDADVLKLIADYMHSHYQDGRLLNGLIYLHPITLNRATGSEMRRTRLFKKILGEDAYSRVIIATTMWDNFANAAMAAQRSEERVKRNDVWGDMVHGGAAVVPHKNNKTSALDIIRKICAFTPVELLLQRELKEANGRLGQTSAGKQLDNDLGEIVNRLKREIEELKKVHDATQAELLAALQKLEEAQSQKENVNNTWIGRFFKGCTVL